MSRGRPDAVRGLAPVSLRLFPTPPAGRGGQHSPEPHDPFATAPDPATAGSPQPPPPPGHAGAPLRYQPALDGLRAVAVIAVLAFHGGFSWASGGYLGVSLFFTLSGYLITLLLMDESRRTGRIDLRNFYVRRARRLIPASLLCLALVSAAALGHWFDGVADLGRDIVAAALQVFNWFELSGSHSYSGLVSSSAGVRRPLDHYWSLAIEEQFYWLWPLVFIALLALARRHRRWTVRRSVLTLTGVAVVAAPVIAATFGADAAYWSTPARAGEILIGCSLACTTLPSWMRRWSAALGAAALAVLELLVMLLPPGQGAMYHGALPLVGLLSALVIAGVQRTGSIRALLSTGWLVAIGRRSYGIYLYHWPIFVLVDRQQWELPAAVGFALKCAITLVIACLSYSLVEQPIRRGPRLARAPRSTRRLVSISALATAALIAVTLALPSSTTYYAIGPDLAQRVAIDPGTVPPLRAVTPTATASTTPASTPPTTTTTDVPTTTTQPTTREVATASPDPATSDTPVTTEVPATTVAAAAPTTEVTTTSELVPTRPVRIVIVGDSTAQATGAGLVLWADANPQLAQVSIVAVPGCGFVPGGTWVFDDGSERSVDDACSGWIHDLPGTVGALHPDVVVLLTTSWDVVSRRFAADGPTLEPTDPEFAARIAEAFAHITEAMLINEVPRVVWIHEPTSDPYWLGGTSSQTTPADHQVLHDAMDAQAAANPAVRIADLANWLSDNGLAADHDTRPDGVHLSHDAAERVAREFLGPLLVRAALT